MKPKLKPPGTKRLKLKCDILLSTSAFRFNLRCYIMDGGMQTEFCHACDLKQCGTSRNPHCEFHVHIEGNAKYFLALYGVTDRQADGATISLVYHPPRGCR